MSFNGCYFEGNYTGLGATDSLLHVQNCTGVQVGGSNQGQYSKRLVCVGLLKERFVCGGWVVGVNRS